jgi:hypothetical protein
VLRQARGALRILGSRADDDGYTGCHQVFDALLALFVGQQRPVAH